MESHCNVICKHVYGHQDTRRRTSPSSLTQPNDPAIPTPPMEEMASSLWLHDSLWETQSWSCRDSPRSDHLVVTPDISDPGSPSLCSRHSSPNTNTNPIQHTQPCPSGPTIAAPSGPAKPLSVIANIECDRIASETAKLAADGTCATNLPPTLTPPYPGSRAMLRIGTTWVTSHTQAHILKARWTAPIISYCMEKYALTRTTIDSIAWRSIQSARNKYNAT